MNSHTIEQREFIVLRLAGFERPASIPPLFKARWPDTQCTLADVHANNPDAPHRAILPPELHALYYQERERVLADPSAAPTANRAVRLIELDRLFQDARDRGAMMLAADLLKRIREEQDGAEQTPAGRGNGEGVRTITRTIIDPAEQ